MRRARRGFCRSFGLGLDERAVATTCQPRDEVFGSQAKAKAEAAAGAGKKNAAWRMALRHAARTSFGLYGIGIFSERLCCAEQVRWESAETTPKSNKDFGNQPPVKNMPEPRSRHCVNSARTCAALNADRVGAAIDRGFAVRKRILVVEDDAMQRDVLAVFLSDQRFYVETAVDGLDAVQRARLGWFDVILMDCRLPEIDGLAASRLITDLTRDHGSPKIIALTGWPEMARVQSDGGDNVFFAVEPKPWHPETLLRHIGDTEKPSSSAEAIWPPRREDPCQDGVARPDSPCILLVEDDGAVRALVASALKARGYHVDEAADGLQAVLMMGEALYDAAVIDYDLPKMNGAAAARLVHDLLARADRPRLVALTASPGLMQDKIDGLAGAFSEIVAKSDGLDAVVAAVERCFAVSRPSVVGWAGVMLG